MASGFEYYFRIRLFEYSTTALHVPLRAFWSQECPCDHSRKAVLSTESQLQRAKRQIVKGNTAVFLERRLTDLHSQVAVFQLAPQDPRWKQDKPGITFG